MIIQEQLSGPNFKIFEDELKSEISQCRVETFEKGKVVLRQGAYVRYLPVLIEGSIIVYRQTEDREIVLYYVNEGETCITTLVACLAPKPVNAEAVAAENSVLIMIPIAKVCEWQRRFYSWNEFIIRTLARRQEQLIESFDALAFSKIDQRIKEHLIQLSDRSQDSVINITHQQLANELGTTRVVISRILKCLELEGAVELLRGAIRIKDLKVKHS